MSQMQLQPSRPSLWPVAVVVFGAGLTVSWAVLLGYGIVRLIEYAL